MLLTKQDYDAIDVNKDYVVTVRDPITGIVTIKTEDGSCLKEEDNGGQEVLHYSELSDNFDNETVIEHLKKELVDSNEKLIHISCQYAKCFNYLKGVVKVLKNVYDPMKPACLEEVEQFIKENS